MNQDEAVAIMRKSDEFFKERELDKILILKDFCSRKYQDGDYKQEVMYYINLCKEKLEEYYIDTSVENVKIIEDEEDVNRLKIRLGENKVNNRDEIVDFYKSKLKSILDL